MVFLTTACAGDPADEPPPPCFEVVGGPVLFTGFSSIHLGPDDVLGQFTTFDETTQQTTLHVQIVGLDGVAVAPSSALASGAVVSAVAATPTTQGWAAAWVDDTDLWTTEIAANGEVAEPTFWRWLATDTPVHQVLVTERGYGAVWTVPATLPDATDWVLGLGDSTERIARQGSASVASGDGELGVAENDEYVLRFHRRSLDLEYLGEPDAIGSVSGRPPVCATGSDYFVAHIQAEVGSAALTRIAGGQTHEPLQLSDPLRAARSPTLACGEDSVGVVWHIDPDWLEFAAVTLDGSVASTPLRLDPELVGAEGFTRMASDGDRGYRVAWDEAEGIRLVSLDPCGS